MTDDAYHGLCILREYVDVDKRISELYEQIATVRAKATRATSRWNATRVSGSGSRSAVESSVIRLTELEERLDAEIDRLTALRNQIMDALALLDSERYKRILELRYIQRKPWRAVMKAMDLQERQSFYLHQQALDNFYKNFRGMQ